MKMLQPEKLVLQSSSMPICRQCTVLPNSGKSDILPGCRSSLLWVDQESQRFGEYRIIREGGIMRWS